MIGDLLRALPSKIKAFFGRKRIEEDFREELAAHVDLLAAENEKAGMPPTEARRIALVKLGGREQAREIHREARSSRFFEDFLQDVRYAGRTLRRDAGFFFAAVCIIGLGIGASATIFSVVNAVLIRPLPFRDPGKLVWLINAVKDENDMSGQTLQVNNFREAREQNKSFSDMAAYFAFYGVGDSTLTGEGEPQRLTNVPVSQNFFELLGVQPEHGRWFTPDECKWNGPKVVMLSHALWQRRFGSDPAIVGRAITIDQAPTTVVGILPASFDFGSIFTPGSRVDLVSPFPLTDETNRWGNTISIIGRLRPGVTLQSAQAEFDVLGANITKAHPERNSLEPQLSPLADHIAGRFRPALWVLTCAVGVVMLIVCANLSNLMLARGTGRQKEIAIRAALGAGRYRLIRQVLTESAVLSLSGAGLGLLLAYLGTRVLSHLTAFNIPLLEEVHVDMSVLLFAAGVGVATGMIVGVAPAMHLQGDALQDNLKDADRGTTQGHGRTFARNALVVSEIALACVLFVGAGLLARSFLHVLEIDLGFRPEHAAAVRIDPTSEYSTQQKRNAYFTEALHAVRERHGIEAVGLSDSLPLGRNRTWGVSAKGKIYKKGEYDSGFVRVVSDGYLQAMGIPLKAGRDFKESDTDDSLPVIIVNETLAKELWPGEDPLGKIMRADRPERTVVGVVGDVHHLALERKSGGEFYLPIRQTNDYPSVDLVVRSSLSSGELAATVRYALKPIAPELPITDIRPVQSLVDRAASPRRFVVTLLGGFALFALLLASMGIYAVISYSVNQRRLEIGIRMALGASPADVRSMVLRETMRLAALGLALGLAGALAISRLATSLLYGVTATDPPTFAAMVVTLAGVAALAGCLPALRAARIEPTSALRAS